MTEDIEYRLAKRDDDFRVDGEVDFQDVQQSAWGDTDLQTIPSHMFVAAADRGNVQGAFKEDGRVIGFTYSMREDEETAYLHMMGVAEEDKDEEVGPGLLTENLEYWRREEFSQLTFTYDPLEGRNPNVYLNKEYDYPARVTRFYPDYYPDEEDAHRFRVEFRLDEEEDSEVSTDPDATLLAVGDDGTVDGNDSLAAYDDTDGWELPAHLPDVVAVGFPWDAYDLSESPHSPGKNWENTEDQWLEAICDVFSELLPDGKSSGEAGRGYVGVDMVPYGGTDPYESGEWGAANRYVLERRPS